MKRIVPLLLGLLLGPASGCGGDILWQSWQANPDTMAQSWELDRLRVLGVQSEVRGSEGVGEPAPGETVDLRSLTVHPTVTEGLLVAWFGCLLEPGTSFGCTVDPSVLDSLLGATTATTPDLEALAEAGFLGVEGLGPLYAPVLQVPADLLDGLTEAQQQEGLNYYLTVIAFADDGSGQVADTDLELAYKRVPVSLAATPNGNPTLAGVTLDGNLFADGTRVLVRAGETYSLGGQLVDGALEEYLYLTSDGVEEVRVEEPYVTFYVTGGELLYPYNLYPYLDSPWTAPAEAGVVQAWVVARDRRGGMAWATVELEVR